MYNSRYYEILAKCKKILSGVLDKIHYDYNERTLPRFFGLRRKVWKVLNRKL